MMRPGKHYVHSNIRLTISLATSGCTMVDTETVQVTLVSPCGTKHGPYVFGEDANISRNGTGEYFLDFKPPEAGRWHFRWETSDDDELFDVAEEGDFLVQSSRFFDGAGRRAYCGC